MNFFAFRLQAGMRRLQDLALPRRQLSALLPLSGEERVCCSGFMGTVSPMPTSPSPVAPGVEPDSRPGI
ncbi:hypothetical protein WMY93_021985 [Mugilogobius chulae]|uniref:Uncharacterized protein n=1 Tax=Mugilogobius chulae TaxID=88201 RepID=A0AAW0NDF6_9GOBI